MNRFLALRFPLLSALIGLFVFAGCGDDTADKSAEDTGVTDVGGADVGTEDVRGDTGTQQNLCPNAGEKVCGGKCVDVTYSMDHCGECDNSCAIGSMTCRDSACECLGERDLCDGRCYNLQFSREHCGECDNRCPDTHACQSGDCVEISQQDEVVGVLQATNEARASSQDCGVNGVYAAAPAVQLNDLLNAAAQKHAEDMAANDFLDHTGSDGTSPGQRAANAGYQGSRTGENIARRYETAEQVVQGWIDSDGHCKNLMNDAFDELGVGYAVANNGEEFWVQLFGSR